MTRMDTLTQYMRERADRELVAEAQQGNRDALGELFSRYWRAARSAAFGVTGDIPSTEDAAAEAFRQTLVSIYSLRDPDRFAPWLRTIVMRKARVLQHRRQTESSLAAAMADPGREPDDELADLQSRAVVQRAVSELPGRLREVVSLFYFEGYDPTTAARFLDIPDGNLPTPYARGPQTAPQRCRTHLAERSVCERRIEPQDRPAQKTHRQSGRR